MPGDAGALAQRSRNGHHRRIKAYGPSGRSPWLDIDWRKHQRWIRVGDQQVNTIELGEGPPLVFVHCLAGWWANWLEQLPVFASERRVIALDLPGFGYSPMPRGPASDRSISISSYARLLDGLLDELGVDAAAVVGNSLGGFVSTELAIAFPQRVERLVLISAAGLSTYRSPRTTRALNVLHRFEPVLAALAAWGANHAQAIAGRPELRKLALSGFVSHPGRLPGPLMAELVRGSGKPGFTAASEALVSYSVRDRLPEIACPTLIVWGDNDRLITAHDADVYAELIPDSRKVVFEDTGHLAMLERPIAFNALLMDFLRE